MSFSGGAVDVSSILRELQTLQAKLQGLQTSDDKPHDRNPDKALYLSGACPAPLRACDPDEEAKVGRTCPDVRVYAPDPLIVDSQGRICYAPADLAKWAGLKNVGDIDALIERAASELLVQLDTKGAMSVVKEKLLEANIMDATKPRLLGIGACKTPDLGAGTCADWSSPQMVKDLSTADVDAGLAEAVAMYNLKDATGGDRKDNQWPVDDADSSLTGWFRWGIKVVSNIASFGGRKGADYVFHGWESPWSATGTATRGDAYGKAFNPATLAYAGAYAWAKKADNMAKRLGGEYEAKYLVRVQKLPSVILQANVAVYASGLAAKYDNKLKNLTFDVAWPMLMERTIGLNGILRAAKSITSLDIEKEAFGKMSAREQWDAIVKQYKKFSRI